MVTSRTDDFKDFHAGLDCGAVRSHGAGTAGDFIDCFGSGAFGGESAEKSGVLRCRSFAAHDFIHHGIGFVIGEVLLVDDFYDGFFDHMQLFNEAPA